MKLPVSLLATTFIAFFIYSGSIFALPTSLKAKDVLTGKETQVVLTKGQKGLVVAFLSAKCPCSGSHTAHLEELSEKYKDFRFVGIWSNAGEEETEAKEVFSKYGVKFTLLSDRDQKIADQFKAVKTPHSFIVGPTGEVLFQGGVSDSSNFTNSKVHYLENALKEISGGQKVSVSDAKALGCYIQRN